MVSERRLHQTKKRRGFAGTKICVAVSILSLVVVRVLQSGSWLATNSVLNSLRDSSSDKRETGGRPTLGSAFNVNSSARNSAVEKVTKYNHSDSSSSRLAYDGALKGTGDPAETTIGKHNRPNVAGRPRPRAGESRAKPRIAILVSYVPSDMWRAGELPSLDHILNKACYAHLWNYDFIFNQTKSLSYLANKTAHGGRSWWLKYGCWERVAHLEAALPSYDWILYGDIDYIVKDFDRPIEDFVREFDAHGKNNVSVLVPGGDRMKGEDPDVFSSFAVLIRNSPFSIRLLENWRGFGMGMCRKGNFPVERYPRKRTTRSNGYRWVFSDQPGLWYALMKTHIEFYPNDVLPKSIVVCNETTGYISERAGYNSPHVLNLGFREYFVGNGLRTGNHGSDLEGMPDDQPILWPRGRSNSSLDSLGINLNWGTKGESEKKRKSEHAFAVHLKRPPEEWPPVMRGELDVCKSAHGCRAARLAGNSTHAGWIEVECAGSER